jgi:hypothetical protein
VNSPGPPPVEKPLVFVSHKHSDREIAETVARFIKEKTANNVRVHLSSSPDFEGPRFGKPLNDELKRALADAEAVILVFTSDTEDWSYCMWECGIATNPTDQRPTSVVVVQCGEDEPKPFGDQLRVDARKLDSVQAFVKALLTSTDFFSRRDTPSTGFVAEASEVKEFAADLHTKLAKVLPSGRGPERSTPTSPYLRIRLDEQATDELKTAYGANDHEKCLSLLETRAEIAENAGGVDNVFNMQLDSGATLGDVLTAWRGDNPGDGGAGWFSALAEQVGSAIVGRRRPVKWSPYRTTEKQADVPYVAAYRRVGTGVELDVYIVPFAPRPIPVTDKMIPVAQMYLKDAAQVPLDQVVLMELVKDMTKQEVTRLPILDDRRPLSIVHKATINEFMVQSIGTRKVEELTLQDILNEHSPLDESYAEVSTNATIAEAKNAMGAKPGCQDVYVMKDGLVVGWLPNVVFI